MKLNIVWLAVALAMATLPVAKAEVVSDAKFPISLQVFIPCANGGAGEVVDISGTLHDVFAVTIDGNNMHFVTVDNPQGISGTGETTGVKYQGTGVTRSDLNVQNAGFPVSNTFVNNFRIIGQGPGNNFLVHENLHVTISANGTVTAYHDNFTFECR